MTVSIGLLGFGLRADAQDLLLGDEIEATLATGDVDRWQFVARDGQMLSVMVRSLDEAFDPIVTIVDERTGTALISNDDYAYPETRDALIEAFSAPRTGTYAIEVRGYGETAGDYSLSLLPGYSMVQDVPLFMSEDWTLVDHSEEATASLETSNQTLVISQSGISERVLVVGPSAGADTYYAELALTSIAGTQGWQVGLVYDYVDEANYQFITVNDAGSWRAVRLRDGSEIVLRDWIGHPAIVAGQSRFDLGAFVREGAVDVFYSGQYIGNFATSGLLEDPQIGVDVQTSSALNSSVTARISEVRISTPVLTDEDQYLFPDQLVASSGNYTVRELERRNLIPSGGEMVLTLPESFAQNVVAGVSRFPLASQSQFSDLVMGATVSWRTIGDGVNGCGLVVRDHGDSDDYLLAYVDSTGGYGLAQREGNTFGETRYQMADPSSDSTYDLLLVAVAERVHFYVDGRYVGNLEARTDAGRIGEAVVNFDALDTACRFDDVWLWQLDSD